MPAEDQPVYGISVAAELSNTTVAALRLYERHGLITPARTDGGTRRYSTDDVVRLQRIAALAAGGVNLAGIERILILEDENADLRAVNSQLRRRK
jgi:MerR family transcriptional regulator, heat shock protein HspR